MDYVINVFIKLFYKSWETNGQSKGSCPFIQILSIKLTKQRFLFFYKTIKIKF